MVRRQRGEIAVLEGEKRKAETEIRLLRKEMDAVILICKFQPASAHDIAKDVLERAVAASGWRYPLEVRGSDE